jgi:hypothetical protein
MPVVNTLIALNGAWSGAILHERNNHSPGSRGPRNVVVSAERARFEVREEDGCRGGRPADAAQHGRCGQSGRHRDDDLLGWIKNAEFQAEYRGAERAALTWLQQASIPEFEQTAL